MLSLGKPRATWDGWSAQTPQEATEDLEAKKKKKKEKKLFRDAWSPFLSLDKGAVSNAILAQTLGVPSA